MIYLAGPAFTRHERMEMEELADALEAAGHVVFLPHRDGLLDIGKVRECTALVLNLNGRVPDEGAVVEAAMAWVLHKPVILYRDDARTLLPGVEVNPLVAGLGQSEYSSTVAEVVAKVERLKGVAA